MPQSPWEAIPQQTIHDLVQQTFSLLLEWEAWPDTGQTPPNETDLSMGVYCDPCQQSAVIVRCSRALATSLTSQLLEIAEADIQQEDLVDAVGELVNVIAGSLRGLLPNLQKMSTPFPLSAQELTCIAADSNTTDYRVGAEPFHVYTVMNHMEAAA